MVELPRSRPSPARAQVHCLFVELVSVAGSKQYMWVLLRQDICGLGAFSKDTFQKVKMYTPPRNWGVPRESIYRRRALQNLIYLSDKEKYNRYQV